MVRKREELEMISEASRQHTRYIVSFPLEAHFRSLPQQYTSSSLWKIQIFTTVTGIHSSEINLQIYTWWLEMRSLYHIIGCQELKPPLGEVKLSTYVLEITDLVHREKVIRGALRDHKSLSFWFTDRHPRRKKNGHLRCEHRHQVTFHNTLGKRCRVYVAMLSNWCRI